MVLHRLRRRGYVTPECSLLSLQITPKSAFAHEMQHLTSTHRSISMHTNTCIWTHPDAHASTVTTTIAVNITVTIPYHGELFSPSLHSTPLRPTLLHFKIREAETILHLIYTWTSHRWEYWSAHLVQLARLEDYCPPYPPQITMGSPTNSAE